MRVSNLDRLKPYARASRPVLSPADRNRKTLVVRQRRQLLDSLRPLVNPIVLSVGMKHLPGHSVPAREGGHLLELLLPRQRIPDVVAGPTWSCCLTSCDGDESPRARTKHRAAFPSQLLPGHALIAPRRFST